MKFPVNGQGSLGLKQTRSPRLRHLNVDLADLERRRAAGEVVVVGFGRTQGEGWWADFIEKQNKQVER